MSLQGLPDFYQPISGEGYQIYYPFENAGDYFVVPDALKVANRPDGSLDFLLELVRGEQPDLPPSPYGVLDFRVESENVIADALLTLRRQHPKAMIQPATFAAGFLRLNPLGTNDDFPPELSTPIPLAWNGLGNTRCTLKVSPLTATLLNEALEADILSLSTYAEMEIAGVAPRLPLQVRFDAKHLLRDLSVVADAQRQIARSALLQFFRQDPDLLPLEITGSIRDRETFAETLTDWVRSEFATFTSAPNDDRQPYLTLNLAPVDKQFRVWDLSQPLLTWRSVILSLNSLEAARTIVQTQGIDSVLRKTTIPTFSTGILSVSVFANLPAHRPSILEVGVTLKAPPFLPFRPQASIATAELISPDDRAQLRLRLSPAEPPAYLATTFVVVEHAHGARKFKSAEVACQGDMLSLNPDHFPVTFLPIEAERSLLDLASITGVCHWIEESTPLEQSFELDRAQPAIALCLPRAITQSGEIQATLDITARSRLTDQTLSLNAIPAKPLRLGLHSFREYGPQSVQIECQFDQATVLMAIDLLPEDQPLESVQIFSFTPDRPQRQWTYFVRSPFQMGYRYRLHAEDPSSPHPWSAVLEPFQPLLLSSLNFRGES
jgi:hypothetical protein